MISHQASYISFLLCLQAVLEVYALHDLDIRPHVLLALVLYKVVDQVRASCTLLSRTSLMPNFVNFVRGQTHCLLKARRLGT